jgi:uncharacterized protein YndB with AHSA1/START domain
METTATRITVEAIMNAPVEKVWRHWTTPMHILKWNTASDDWQTTYSENDIRTGGKFVTRMESRDGSMGFDFGGDYSKIEPLKEIECILGDGRYMQVNFIANGNETTVTEIFEAETENPIEMQRAGWLAILNNFKKHVEGYTNLELLRFEATINTPVEKVYTTMLAENTYREWTAEFNPTSRYRGSWEKGSKILFIGTDKDGIEGGMVSRIKENIPNKFLSVEHLGLLQGDKEITTGKEVEGWAGALENYTFTAANDSTRLVIEMDANNNFKSYFEETWPKALNKLKEICEHS